jgi:hypothetical protein
MSTRLIRTWIQISCDDNNADGANVQIQKSKLIYLFGLPICLIAFAYQIHAQDFVWVQSWSGESYCYGITVDNSGNSSLAGCFRGFASVGSTNLTNAGGADVFLARYDRLGNLIWARRDGGPSDDVAYAVASDPSGNLFVTGIFSGTAQFGATLLTNSGGTDLFVAKYGSTGNPLWARQAGGPGNDNGYSCATDSNGNVYVVGGIGTNASFGSIALTNAGSDDIFVAKYESSGSVLWARRFGGIGPDDGWCVTVDSKNNIYVGGSFVSLVNFGITNLTSVGNRDGFLMRIDSAGNVIWASRFGGSGDDIAYGITTDTDGSIYCVGKYTGVANFGSITLTNAGSSDIFLAKFDTNGSAVWARRGGGTAADEAHSVRCDGIGGVWLTGSYTRCATFGNTVLTNAGGSDICAVKYDVNGNFIVARRGGGSQLTDLGTGIGTDSTGDAYAAGYFSGQGTFGSIPVSGGLPHTYIAKLSCYAITPTSRTHSADQQTNTVAVLACSGSGWTAASDVSWITITAGSSGTGNGTVTYVVAPNTVNNDSTTTRTGTLTIAGQTFTVTQNGVSCTYAISPSIRSHGAGSENGSVSIITTSPCEWQATANVDWIVFQTNSSGIGSGLLNYSLVPNTNSDSRIGVIALLTDTTTIATFTVVQAGVDDLNWNWAQSTTGTPPSDARGITIDSQGNAIVTGYYCGTTTFGTNVVTNVNVASDVFVAKYDKSGNMLWVRHGGGTNHDWGEAITVDLLDNIYVTGWIRGPATFDNINLPAPNFANALFVAKYSPDGQILWAKNAPTSAPVGSYDGGKSIAVDSSSNILVTGFFSTDATFEGVSLSGGGPFLAKYDGQGSLRWAIKLENNSSYGSAEAKGVAVDGGDNIYVTGYQTGRVGFAGAFLAKYDRDGNSLWSHRIQNYGDGAAGLGIVVDKRNHIYLNGYYSGSESVVGSCFLGRYDTDGNLIWFDDLQAAGGGSDGMRISLDLLGNIYLVGGFESTVDFGSGLLFSSGGTDGFVAKFDPEGRNNWTRRFGGAGGDQGNCSAVDQNGNVYLAGSLSDFFWGDWQFDSGIASIGAVTFTNTGMFVAKLAVPFPPTVIPGSTVAQPSGSFQFRVFGPSDTGAIVDTSEDLVTWLPIYTNDFTNGTWDVVDSSATNVPLRFYRIR